MRPLHVTHLKGDMAKPGPVDRMSSPRLQRIVAVDFERRSALAIAGQAEVSAAQVRLAQAGAAVQVHAYVVTLRGNQGTAEEGAIKIGQLTPIGGDQVSVHVFRLHVSASLSCTVRFGMVAHGLPVTT